MCFRFPVRSVQLRNWNKETHNVPHVRSRNGLEATTNGKSMQVRGCSEHKDPPAGGHRQLRQFTRALGPQVYGDPDGSVGKRSDNAPRQKESLWRHTSPSACLLVRDELACDHRHVACFGKDVCHSVTVIGSDPFMEESMRKAVPLDHGAQHPPASATW